MKKLVMSMAVAASAMCLQAASFSWGAANIYAGDAKADGVTGYLLFTDVLSVDAATTALKGGDTAAIKGKASNSTTVSSGTVKAANTVFDRADAEAGNEYSAYFVVFSSDDKSYFMSLTKTVDAQATSTVNINFGNQANATQGVAWTDVGGTGGGDDPGPGPDDPPGPGPDNPPTPGPGGDGDVPEPTSGLLLMIGGAALALRRRR